MNNAAIVPFADELQAIADRRPKDALLLTPCPKLGECDIETFASPKGIRRLKKRLRAAVERGATVCYILQLDLSRDCTSDFKSKMAKMDTKGAMGELREVGLMVLECVHGFCLEASIEVDECVRLHEKGGGEKEVRYYLCAELPRRTNGAAQTLGSMNRHTMAYGQ